MNKIQIYTVDSFSQSVFSGNTCAVCISPEWPEDEILQKIAAQNLFAETAFIVPKDDGLPELRWFTVSKEVDFCGYGTLSAGYVYLTHIASEDSKVIFDTRNYGHLKVEKKGDLYQIETPAKHPLENVFDDKVFAALGGSKPEAMITSKRGDLLIVYQKEQDVVSIKPNFNALMACGYYGYVLTSPGDTADYAYRYFSPRMTNVWEDPVNGASQSVIVPYWSKRLGKNNLHGRAVSQRGGDIYCEYDGKSTVIIGGHVSPYLEGQIYLP